MGKGLVKRGLVLAMIALFLGAGVIPNISANISGQDVSKVNMGRKIIYVDDDNCPGPGDGTEGNPYCKIQYAIDNASDYDEIRVYDGTYYENIWVDKPLDIIGNGSETTTIDGNNKENVTFIDSSDVTFKNFTITNSGPGPLHWGMFLNSETNLYISHNHFINNTLDMEIHGCQAFVGEVIVSYNVFERGKGGDQFNKGIWGVYLSNRVQILHNEFRNKVDGLFVWDSQNITVKWNTFENCSRYGLYLRGSRNSRYINNNIVGNHIGVYILESEDDRLNWNNIYHNTWGVDLKCDNYRTGSKTNARHNYWGTIGFPWGRVVNVPLRNIIPYETEIIDIPSTGYTSHEYNREITMRPLQLIGMIIYKIVTQLKTNF